MRARDFPSVLLESAGAWVEDNALRLSASLAFYSIFSLAPLLVIAVSIAALVFSEETVREQVSAQLEALAGPRAADALETLLAATATQKRTGTFTAIAGIAVLLFGASTVFAELKDALNTIWGVVVKPGRPFFTLVRDRFFSFSIVLAIGFLLLVSLIISILVEGVGYYMSGRFQFSPAIWKTWD